MFQKKLYFIVVKMVERRRPTIGPILLNAIDWSGYKVETNDGHFNRILLGLGLRPVLVADTYLRRCIGGRLWYNMFQGDLIA